LDHAVGFLSPATEAEVERVSRQIGQPIHKDLRSVWRLYGGQKCKGAGVTGLFGPHRLLTPAEAVEGYDLIWNYCEQEKPPPLSEPKVLNRPVLELVPFASWDAYMLCIHAFDGKVWEFLPSPGLLRHRASIEVVLNELLEAVRSREVEPDLAW
jgi:hypothetical protein